MGRLYGPQIEQVLGGSVKYAAAQSALTQESSSRTNETLDTIIKMGNRYNLIRKLSDWAAKQSLNTPGPLPSKPTVRPGPGWKSAEPTIPTERSGPPLAPQRGGVAWKRTELTGLKGLADFDYRLEKAAPWHAFGDDLARLYGQWGKEGKPSNDFFTWLKSLPSVELAHLLDKELADIETFMKGVQYLEERDRSSYSCDFWRDHVWWKGVLLNTPSWPEDALHGTEKMGIWVMSPSNIFYTAAGKVREFHHSSFLAGGFVKAAGQWKVVSGKVTAIDNNTGHYQSPVEQLATAVRYLTQKSVFKPECRVEAIDKEGDHAYGSVAKFLSKVKDPQVPELTDQKGFLGAHRT